MRVAKAPIGFDVLVGMMSGHPMCKVETDLPPDAKAVTFTVDLNRRVAYVWIESASFADVPEYSLVPEFDVHATVSVTEEAMLADLVSRRHDYCRHCGEPLADDA